MFMYMYIHVCLYECMNVYVSLHMSPAPLLNQDMTIVKTHNDKLMKLNDSNLVV